MSEKIERGDISDDIQRAIVDAALRAATSALATGREPAEATEHARTTAEAGVRAWQIANGLITEPLPS